jgi:hypothetical protein
MNLFQIKLFPNFARKDEEGKVYCKIELFDDFWVTHIPIG